MDNLKRIFRNMDPFIWVLVILLLANNLLDSSMSLKDWAIIKLVTLPGIIIAITFHEFAHGFASYKLGDPTPKNQGRLSLNPKRHMDPVGFICLLIAGFGWGEPVQINPLFYKHRRRDELIVALAGVVTNFILAVIFAFITKAVYQIAVSGGMISYIIYLICYYCCQINLVLMIFNLIPCPPLDGWNVITQIFDLQRYEWWYVVYRFGNMILMFLILFGITRRIISPLVSTLLGILM